MIILHDHCADLLAAALGLLALGFIAGTDMTTVAANEPDPNTDNNSAVTVTPILESAKVLFLLHGMNSDPSTWNDFIALKFDNSCPTIAGGVLTDNPTPNPQGVLCYRIRFGSFDATSGRLGLEGVTATSPSSGDFSTFAQLGQEARRAVRAILNRHRNAEVVMLGHSRGGLAARAFLQQAGSRAKASIVGLLTTGTPHRGSRLSRSYRYLETHPRQACQNTPCQADWEVVDFLRGERGCFGTENPEPLDVRRPTIHDLADDALAIDELNQGIGLLPADIQYGQIVYKGLDLGILKTDIPLFGEYSVFDREGRSDICDQVSKDAERFILGDDAQPSQYPGDGVISAANQRYFNLPGFPGSLERLNRLRVEDEIVHTEEPRQEAHISMVLTDMMGPWWSGP
jgi:pimeloyl-ACP methyl ester carboxylesterase